MEKAVDVTKLGLQKRHYEARVKLGLHLELFTEKEPGSSPDVVRRAFVPILYILCLSPR